MKKVLFTATVDSHILHFHIPYLKYFKKKGYEVHVATNSDEKIPFCDKKIKIPFERSPYKLNNLKAIKDLKKVVDEEKYDIIHTHTPMGSVVTRLAAKSARKKYGTRVIYTAHGLHFFKGASKLNWLLFYPIEKYLSKYTDTLILINQEDYNLCVEKFKKCKDIKYVPGVGVDEEKFSFEMTNKEKKELRESLKLNEDDFVLIYPARLDTNKNHIFLINIMQKLPQNVHLLLPGLDELKGFNQEYTKKLGLTNRVHFLGFRTDIPQLIKISDLGISVSIREGLGLNLIEENFCEIPVIASNNRGHRDIIKNGLNGYMIDEFIEEKYVDKIKELIDNKDLYKKIKNTSKKTINKFTLKYVMKSMVKIYESK